MPERYYRGERDRDYDSEGRHRSNGRRGEWSSERRNHYAHERERWDRDDRYGDGRRGYDRYDEVRPSNYEREDHRRHSGRYSGNQYEHDAPADGYDRYTHSRRLHEEMEETGSSEMRSRRRRDKCEGPDSHETNRNNLKRERSEECESEPAKRRRSTGDNSRSDRRHFGGSDREEDFGSRIGDIRSFERRTNRMYDVYPREDTGRNVPQGRRYSYDNGEAHFDYERHRDRAYGRRSRQEFENEGDEEQSARPSKRRASDTSPPQERRTGRYRSLGSPGEARIENSPTRGARSGDDLHHKRRDSSGDARVGNLVRRGRVSQGNGGEDNDMDAQTERFHEMPETRPMRSGLDDHRRGFGDRERSNQSLGDVRSGFRHRERGDQARDENQPGFGAHRHADQARNEFRRGTGPRDRDDHRFRGIRPQEGAQQDRRQFNRFDTPRPSRGRCYGGTGRGRFQQEFSEPVGPTVVQEVPIDENIVYDPAVFKYGYVVHVEEVWSTPPSEKIPEAYKRIEAEMRRSGEIGDASKTETENENQGATASEDADGTAVTRADGGEKKSENVVQHADESSKNSNSDGSIRDDEMGIVNDRNCESKGINRATQRESRNEKMIPCIVRQDGGKAVGPPHLNADTNEKKNSNRNGNGCAGEARQGTSKTCVAIQGTVRPERNIQQKEARENDVVIERETDETSTGEALESRSFPIDLERVREEDEAGGRDLSNRNCSTMNENVMDQKEEKE
ncbi:hypothetical protein FGB62_87g0105 [Gracilaria domingensis]|nr:hypothetical protein FGB62_87g0105 [Gracilaria domingensis]